MQQDKLSRIAVFYDGNYFFQVSNYYAYGHEKKRRISISGLHNFIRHKVAEFESSEYRLCQIVDAHYFRGRLRADEAQQKGDMLYYERVFDDILMSEGVTTHYLPIRMKQDGQWQEKGVDVTLALEVYELSFYKRFNIVVLVAGDGDYAPLVRKLNSLGIKVMVLSWDFEYTNYSGKKITTVSSQYLLEEVTYPILMHELIDKQSKKVDTKINDIFVPSTPTRNQTTVSKIETLLKKGEIMSLKNGYGFIKYPPNNLFFHFSNLVEVDFNELKIGDSVSFSIGLNDEGNEIAENIRLI